MSRRRRRRPGRWVLLLIIVATIAVGWWWFTSPPQGKQATGVGEEASSRAPREPVVSKSTPRTTLDPVTRARRTRPRDSASTTIELTPSPAEPSTGTAGAASASTTSTGPEQAPSKAPTIATTAGSAAKPRSPGRVEKPAPKSNPAPTTSPASTTSTKPSAPRIAVRPATPPRSSGANELSQALAQADQDPIAARQSLSKAWARGLVGDERETARLLSRRLADATLFEGVRRSGSPYASPYRIKSGDAMSRIVRKQNVNTNLDFVARVNGIKNLNRIRENQEIWLPRGLFHVVVDRAVGDMAVYQEIDGTRHLLMVVPVVVGRDDLTPTVLFQVRAGSKRRNPSWTDPASGVRWAAADPRNPVGEFWIGLEPADPNLRGDPNYQGFGLHGTGPQVEFGDDASSGSLQVREEDAEILFELLRSGRSTIDIRS